MWKEQMEGHPCTMQLTIYQQRCCRQLLLLEKEADPDVDLEAQNRMTPLQYAVLHDNREVAWLLTGKGADPNVKGTSR